MNHIGMHPVLSRLQRTLLQPISNLLFPVQADGGFDGHHSFMVQYKAGQDLGLDMHTDDSDVTFNLCLGRNFSGASLTVCGDSRTADHRQFFHSYVHVIGRCLVRRAHSNPHPDPSVPPDSGAIDPNPSLHLSESLSRLLIETPPPYDARCTLALGGMGRTTSVRASAIISSSGTRTRAIGAARMPSIRSRAERHTPYPHPIRAACGVDRTLSPWASAPSSPSTCIVRCADTTPSPKSPTRAASATHTTATLVSSLTTRLARRTFAVAGGALQRTRATTRWRPSYGAPTSIRAARVAVRGACVMSSEGLTDPQLRIRGAV